MKLRHRICCVMLSVLIVVSVSLSPFGKKVYAAEPISMSVILLLMAMLNACGIVVDFMAADVLPESNIFPSNSFDGVMSMSQREERIGKMRAHMQEDPKYAAMLTTNVGAKIQPFIDKLSLLAKGTTLSGMAAVIGMGVSELLDKAKTGTLELTKEQAIAMQQFMAENFGEVMSGNLSVMNGTTVTFADMCSVPHPLSLTISEENRTNYYTNTRTKEYFYMTFPKETHSSGFDFNASFYQLLGSRPTQSVGGFTASLREDHFPNGYSSLVYTFDMDRGLNRLYISTSDPAFPHNMPYFYSPYMAVTANPIDWQATDSIIVSTDAPTLAATGSLQFPTTKLPLTVPSPIVGGVSIPVPQDMDGAIDKALTDAIARAEVTDIPDVPDVPGEIPPFEPPGVPNFMMPGNITNKFPFSIPFDIVKGAKLLVAPPVTPKFDVSFSIPAPGKDIPINFTVDLTPFDKIAAMCRTFSVLVFTVGLAVATPKIVKGVK